MKFNFKIIMCIVDQNDKNLNSISKYDCNINVNPNNNNNNNYYCHQ